jgi:acyl carrier protein
MRSLFEGNLTRVGVGRMRLDRAIASIPEFRELGYFEEIVAEFDRPGAESRPTVAGPDLPLAPVQDWSAMSTEDRCSELTVRLQAILARALRMPASAVDVDRPFPELGLDSMMAMTVLKDAQQLADVDLSASMLWNHPTISLLAAYVAEMLEPEQEPVESSLGSDEYPAFDSAGGVLDELFGSVEAASTGSESGGF